MTQFRQEFLFKFVIKKVIDYMTFMLLKLNGRVN